MLPANLQKHFLLLADMHLHGARQSRIQQYTLINTQLREIKLVPNVDQKQKNNVNCFSKLSSSEMFNLSVLFACSNPH